MTDPALIVAIEGPCCAGKTTLGQALLGDLGRDHQVEYVRDYADWAGGGRHLPPPMPDTIAGEERALRQLLAIEVDRTAAARAASHELDLVLIDRSVHTLLAHCAALTALTGTDHAATADRIVRPSAGALWPDLVLYLDIDHTVVHARNNGKFPPGSLFTDTRFNQAIRSYFHTLTGMSQPRVRWLDGAHSARLLHLRAKAHLIKSLPISAEEEDRP